MTEPNPDKQTNFQSAVVGSAIDGGTVNARNIAGGDIHEHHHYAPEPEKPTFPFHQIAHPQNPNFTGREQILQQVEAALSTGQTTVVTQTIAGLGGVGKTQLALAYSYAHLADYDLIYWLSADSEPGLGEDLLTLARRLKLVPPTQTDQNAAVQVLHNFLGQIKQRWLLVFDNADMIEPRQLVPALPRTGNGHILITSRNPNWRGIGKVLELGLFTLDEAVNFLLKYTGKNKLNKGVERLEAEELAKELGLFPLALEHAAAYIVATGCNFAHYYQLFISHQIDLLKRAEIPDSYHATITTTWTIAIDEVKKIPGTLDLLNLCCFLDPNSVSLDLIRQIPDLTISEKPVFFDVIRDDVAFDKVLIALKRYSLIQRNDNVLTLHRLVQSVVKSNLSHKLIVFYSSITFKLIATALQGDKVENFLFYLPHLHYLDVVTLDKASRNSDDSIVSKDELSDYFQYLDQSFSFWDSNLTEIKRLLNNWNSLLKKYENIDSSFQSFPNISHEALHNLKKQFADILKELQLAYDDIQSSFFTDIPNFVREEKEKEVENFIELTRAILGLIDIAIQQELDSY